MQKSRRWFLLNNWDDAHPRKQKICLGYNAARFPDKFRFPTHLVCILVVKEVFLRELI